MRRRQLAFSRQYRWQREAGAAAYCPIALQYRFGTADGVQGLLGSRHTAGPFHSASGIEAEPGRDADLALAKKLLRHGDLGRLLDAAVAAVAAAAAAAAAAAVVAPSTADVGAVAAHSWGCRSAAVAAASRWALETVACAVVAADLVVADSADHCTSGLDRHEEKRLLQDHLQQGIDRSSWAGRGAVAAVAIVLVEAAKAACILPVLAFAAEIGYGPVAA